MPNYPFNIHFPFIPNSNLDQDSKIVNLTYQNQSYFKKIDTLASEYFIDLNQV